MVGYEGLYQISSWGRVKSLSRIDSRGHKRKEKMRDLSTDKDGYKYIGLSKKGEKRKNYRIHRLVATAFIPNPNNLPYINHKDTNPSNNHVDNLEWCTIEYNNNYGDRIKKAKESIRKKCNNNEHSQAIKVKCITTNEIFVSAREAERKYNISHSNILHCCKGKQKYAGKHPITGEKLVWAYYKGDDR